MCIHTHLDSSVSLKNPGQLIIPLLTPLAKRLHGSSVCTVSPLAAKSNTPHHYLQVFLIIFGLRDLLVVILVNRPRSLWLMFGEDSRKIPLTCCSIHLFSGNSDHWRSLWVKWPLFPELFISTETRKSNSTTAFSPQVPLSEPQVTEKFQGHWALFTKLFCINEESVLGALLGSMIRGWVACLYAVLSRNAVPLKLWIFLHCTKNVSTSQTYLFSVSLASRLHLYNQQKVSASIRGLSQPIKS